jgi:hypothetical protein
MKPTIFHSRHNRPVEKNGKGKHEEEEEEEEEAKNLYYRV